TYPTSLWSPGEVVEDEHQLSLPDAARSGYLIRVGAYLPLSGEHLLAPNGERSVVIGRYP
ncbi:MAG: hypothetical protein N0A03_10510, partial [Anaerolineae bacterium]|nr:hypothetical protein [Anaerolineae bacterium]